MSVLRNEWLRSTLAAGLAVIATLTSYELLDRSLLVFSRWCFYKYVQPIDPDPPFLPFLGTSLWIIPQFAAAIGGFTGGLFCGRSKLYFAIVAGFCGALSWLVLIYGDFTPMLGKIALLMWAVGSSAWAVTLYAVRRGASFRTGNVD